MYNTELPKLLLWLRSNKLALNIQKTNYIVFHSNKKLLTNFNHKIIIDDVEIEKKSCVKFLGIFIDEHLSWNQQVDHIQSQVSRIIGIVYKLRDVLPPNALLMLYKSFILSYFNHGVITWGHSYSKHIDSIHKLQKRAVRLCTGSHYLAHTNPIFKRLRLLKVSDINTLQTAIFMFKLRHNILPSNFNSMFTLNWQIHSYNTRNSDNFHLTNPRTTLSSKSIRHRGPDVWHSLSNEIKQCSFLSSFKKQLKTKLIAEYND